VLPNPILVSGDEAPPPAASGRGCRLEGSGTGVSRWRDTRLCRNGYPGHQRRCRNQLAVQPDDHCRHGLGIRTRISRFEIDDVTKEYLSRVELPSLQISTRKSIISFIESGTPFQLKPTGATPIARVRAAIQEPVSTWQMAARTSPHAASSAQSQVYCVSFACLVRADNCANVFCFRSQA
jgi:hypothetical protein